eukprot:2096877-Pyramimonas_sp.AAC.1
MGGRTLGKPSPWRRQTGLRLKSSAGRGDAEAGGTQGSAEGGAEILALQVCQAGRFRHVSGPGAVTDRSDSKKGAVR